MFFFSLPCISQSGCCTLCHGRSEGGWLIAGPYQHPGSSPEAEAAWPLLHPPTRPLGHVSWPDGQVRVWECTTSILGAKLVSMFDGSLAPYSYMAIEIFPDAQHTFIAMELPCLTNWLITYKLSGKMTTEAPCKVAVWKNPDLAL